MANQNAASRAANARKADSPWRRQSSTNARKNAARKKMSLLEREIGMTVEQYTEFHQLQRERVFERYGINS